MGRATILANLGEGRYRLQMDWGAQKKQDNLSAANEALNKLQIKLAQVNAQIVQADAAEDELRAQLEAEIVAYEAVIAAANAKGQAPPKPEKYLALLKKLRETEGKNQLIRTLKKSLEQNKSELFKKIAYWNAFEAVEQRDAWCCNYSIFEEVGKQVGTVDIPGESNIILVKPNASAPSPADGNLVAREVMSPEQVYFNAAILPGWQKFLPTFRTGVVLSISRVANTCSVQLEQSLSSAQSLDINQSTQLDNVPFAYDPCGHEPFMPGDRAVVQFDNQQWANPKVIGFVDGPRECPAWPTISVVHHVYEENINDASQSREWFSSVCFTVTPQNDGSALGTCGVFGVFENTEESIAADVYLGFFQPTLPAFAVGKFTLDALVPGPVFIGRHTYSGFGYAPRGNPPAVYINRELSGSGTWLIRKSSMNFGEITLPTTNISSYDEMKPDEGWVCAAGGYKTGQILTGLDDFAKSFIRKFNQNEAFETYEFAAWYYALGDAQGNNSQNLKTVHQGFADEILGMPSISVAYRGRTRKYALASRVSNTLYFQPVPYENE